MNLVEIKKLNIPTGPGSYQFFDDNGKIIYIGKASNLRNRILSYWQESTSHSPAKHSMMKIIKSLKWIQTDSEIEALLLESNLIKKHQPNYNVLMRDDKRFSYIKISTEDEFPRVFLTRTVDHAGRYFGPFTSQLSAKETIKILRKIWPYRSCRTMGKSPCLYFRIGKCLGPCGKKTNQKEYKDMIKQITLFLEGKKTKIINNYELRIKNHEKELKKEKKEEKRLSIEVQLQNLKYQLKNFQHVIESSKIINVSEKYANDVVELAKTLGLPKVPQRIEGYDISNIFGKNAVGSMVVFNDGEPNKNEYRKFKIKIDISDSTFSNDKHGDVQMLAEILERRFNNDWPEPDLIIIDGGKAQVNIGTNLMRKLNKEILVIGISKGEGLRSASAPDKLFFSGEKKPLELPIASPALHIIKRVRDEAHRFAIEYHKKLRKKKFFNK